MRSQCYKKLNSSYMVNFEFNCFKKFIINLSIIIIIINRILIEYKMIEFYKYISNIILKYKHNNDLSLQL